jgi:hypothetical protein
MPSAAERFRSKREAARRAAECRPACRKADRTDATGFTPATVPRLQFQAWTPAQLSPLLLPLDQHRLLPPPRRLVGPVDAPRPATGPLLPLQQLLDRPRDPPRPRRRLLRILDPADELVSPQRRQSLPKPKHLRVAPKRRLKIVPRLMNGAVRETVGPCTLQVALCDVDHISFRQAPRQLRWLAAPRLCVSGKKAPH